MAGKMQAPALLVAGVHDKQVTPDRVRALYDDHRRREKVFVDLGCSSHNAMWERNHLLLFSASLDWLTTGVVGRPARASCDWECGPGDATLDESRSAGEEKAEGRQPRVRLFSGPMGR